MAFDRTSRAALVDSQAETPAKPRDKFGINRISRLQSAKRPAVSCTNTETASTEPAAPGNRRAHRKSTRSLGYLIDHSGRELECTVHDISGTGAKVTLSVSPRKPFEAPAVIPETFRLLILQDGIEVEAKLVWTSDATCGIEFQSAFRPARQSVLARM